MDLETVDRIANHEPLFAYPHRSLSESEINHVLEEGFDNPDEVRLLLEVFFTGPTKSGTVATTQLHMGWIVRMTWEVLRGRPEPVSISIEGDGHSKRVTGQGVRNIPIGTLIDAARWKFALADRVYKRRMREWDSDPATERQRQLATFGENTPESLKEQVVDIELAVIRMMLGREQESLVPFVTQHGPQRGTTITDEVLSQVAAVYRKAWDGNVGVAKAVADAFVISESAASKRIQMARAKGFLDGVGKGTR